jgi:transposase
MDRGNDLSDFTNGQIDALFTEGKSEREISERVGKSKTAIHNYINKDVNYLPGKRGRKRKLSEREDRVIKRAASNSRTSSRRITQDL